MAKINVIDTEIAVISAEERDYISLTDMANAKESESRAADIIKNWLRNRYTLEFIGVWEQINNPNFIRKPTKLCHSLWQFPKTTFCHKLWQFCLGDTIDLY